MFNFNAPQLLKLYFQWLFSWPAYSSSHGDQLYQVVWSWSLRCILYLSWNRKWAFLIVFGMSVRKLFTFSSSSPEPLDQSQTNLVQSIFGWWKFIFFSNEGPHSFPKGYPCDIAKINRRNFKIFYSRTTGPISTKLGT